MERSVGMMKDEIRRLRQRPALQPDPSWETTIAGQRSRIAQLEDDLGNTKRLYEQVWPHAGIAGILLTCTCACMDTLKLQMRMLYRDMLGCNALTRRPAGLARVPS